MDTLEIVRVLGLATVQDRGRPGRLFEGVPAGGPFVPELWARANLAAGNPPGAAAIEVFGGITIRAGDEPAFVASDEGTLAALAPRQELHLAPSPRHRVRYVAVRGGIDVPVVLGGRGTLLVARLGGFEGRALRAGDRLPVGSLSAPPSATTGLPPGWLDEPVRVVLGPDVARFEPSALAELVSGAFTVLPESDRVGTRLSGPRLARSDGDDARSMPMVDGAIEVPASGAPIVLGPDHPTTGGYPVIAVIVRADVGRFAARPIGAPVRFRAVTAR
jgi:biotin-dependent carboxylase-like uncharacterized protein